MVPVEEHDRISVAGIDILISVSSTVMRYLGCRSAGLTPAPLKTELDIARLLSFLTPLTNELVIKSPNRPAVCAGDENEFSIHLH